MAERPKIPVTMLSGFLGAGKTTLLRYLLENSKEKIACIVNDVASINIDAKLVRNDRNRSREQQINTTSDLADTIELANGCACCSLQDELFASFEQVLALADKSGEPYARIVLENSGVAEPQALRDKFVEAASEGHPVTERVELDSLVTLVDSGAFIKDYASRQPLAARPDLGDGGTMRPVVDLLVEQVECADYVVLNKVDLLPGGVDGPALEQLMAIVSTLNPLAAAIACERGQVPLEEMFGAGARRVVAALNIEGQHRGAVAAARTAEAAALPSVGHKRGSSDGEGSRQEEEGEEGLQKHKRHSGDGCDGEHGGHDHHHHHGEGDHHHHHHDKEASKHEEAHHQHKHHHDAEGDGAGNGHHHEHGMEGCAACHTEGAASESGAQGGEHQHAHQHQHQHSKGEHKETRAAARFGIRSFVYERRRPFHPQRLRDMVLRWLPVSENRALEGAAPELGDSPIKRVLRSKGFMWMSSSHATAYYWSHAGQHFEIRDEGDWWGAVADDEWPSDPAQRRIILSDFAAGCGDRRQEIVFIGVNMDQDKICAQLDTALLTEAEMARYREKWGALQDPPHEGEPGPGV